MKNPQLPVVFIVFATLLAMLLLVIQFGVVTLSFSRLGVSGSGAAAILVLSLLGSLVNVPLFTLRAEREREPLELWLLRIFGLPPQQTFDTTLIAVNVGGCLIPVAFSVYLIFDLGVSLIDVVWATTLVTLVSFVFSQPVKKMGIMMPVLIAPLSAALLALLLNPEQRAPLAYISGTLGVLIGADLLRLFEVPHLQAPVASIGGAGTFDGVFITGVLAVLLTG